MKILFLLGSLFFVSSALAQRGGGGQNPALASLKTVTPPVPTGLDTYVLDQTALVVLGKALFWDMQAGSDGNTACASCHFHAGADHRLQNELSGPDAVVNQVLASQNFPFHKLSNTGNNRSTVLSDKQQSTGSIGVVASAFVGIQLGAIKEVLNLASAPAAFVPNGIHMRQVTARNSPTVINSAYYVRNFWDGRASNIFTGATPFGDSDTGLHALALRNGTFQWEAVRIQNASLASQAVGPILSSVEMSAAGRSWPDLGTKLLSLPPLARQKVSPTDSVLGAIANPDGNGLSADQSYSSLIQAAFRPEYYSSSDMTNGYSQMANNFSLFWGLSIQAYESTLNANDSRVDQFLEGRTGVLTALEQQGFNEFTGGGSQCTNCHNGAEITAAGWSNYQRQGGNIATPTEAGFFRIGLRPVAEDLGLGGNDDFGLPLFSPSPSTAAGTFKVPGLRNVELTGPYFHNGSQATLEQVLQFYGRNADFPTGANLGNGIGQINLSQTEQTEVVAFLKALTDDRVRFQRAPFDHPSLCVPNGQVQSAGQLQIDGTQSGSVALDMWALVSEVGKDGLSVPLQTFEELLSGKGNDGTRANTMTTGCTP